MTATALSVIVYVLGASRAAAPMACDTPDQGYQCSPELTHSWGQYSPYHAVPSKLDAGVPDTCSVTFAQLLSRHGARSPSSKKTKLYGDTVAEIQESVTSYGQGYEFIANYSYALGADQLTDFGRQQMVNSGIKFFQRYRPLSLTAQPFLRATDLERVVESATKWREGFYQARTGDPTASGLMYTDDMVVIPEADGTNNTLNHGLCTAFESGEYAKVGRDAQAEWLEQFAPAIVDRLNTNMPGKDFTNEEAVYLMDICPFDTVASTRGESQSPFCGLFTSDDWAAYDHYGTLDKYYGHGPGNPLGPTQGVGWVNELVARLTNSAVVDHTSTNATLDASATTFPLGRGLYADFSHDNDMAGVMGALGLYDSASPPSKSSLGAEDGSTDGYFRASRTVSFAARMYVEKMVCQETGDQELVRVLVNDRVVPLEKCGPDSLGRCALDKFVQSLKFARSGGHWDQCFVESEGLS